MEVMDATSHLNEQGYWASYNVPFFESVYRVSGYEEKRANQGNEFSYFDCPRARIFREEQVSAVLRWRWARGAVMFAPERRRLAQGSFHALRGGLRCACVVSHTCSLCLVHCYA